MSNPQLSSLQHGLIEKDGSASESLYKTDIILLSKEHGDFQVTVKAVDVWGYVYVLTSLRVFEKKVSVVEICDFY